MQSNLPETVTDVVERGSPSTKAVNLYVWVMVEDVIGEVATGHAGNAGDEHAHEKNSLVLGQRSLCWFDPLVKASYNR